MLQFVIRAQRAAFKVVEKRFCADILAMVVMPGGSADEEQELADLRKLIGADNLDRLRPTGASSGVSYPTKRPVTVQEPAKSQKQQIEDEDDLLDSDREHPVPWDSRSGRANPVRDEQLWKEYSLSARKDRSARYGSARYGRAVHGFDAEYTNKYVSRKEALEWYHREMNEHSNMWAQRQYTNSLYSVGPYVAGDAWLHTSKQLELNRPRKSPSPPRKPISSAPESYLRSRQGAKSAAGAAAARRSKGDLQEEDAVAGQETSEAPKPRRRVGVSQTGRGTHSHSHGRTGGPKPSTSRGAPGRWTPPVSGGWDSSPLRATPYALRGMKPVTDEPWARPAV